MAETEDNQATDQARSAEAKGPQLEGGTYEIIRGRLNQHAKDLSSRLATLNAGRKEVFGSIETKLLNSERISTDNNCVPRDMVSIGGKFIFGYNVFIGLRSETRLEDVFAVYEWRDGQFHPQGLDLIRDDTFISEFKNLYKYYRGSVFSKFAVFGPHLFMVFRVGKDVGDVKTFKWLIRDDSLEYLDSRSDHEYRFPPQHEFEWRRVTHGMQRSGVNPHISLDDRVFVETIGGDLTVKIEDNTKTGQGIYSEPVDNPDQTLDDADIHYAIVGHIILIKVRPYQEQDFRYLVYNEKIQRVTRIDSIADACVLLPEAHGLVFPKGYYLQTGDTKLFDIDMDQMVFEKRIASPNGEDYLFVFYNRDSGVYVLLSYNVITQQVSTPFVCNGFSYFDDGTLLGFRADAEPQRHHVIQIWQTPYCGADYVQAIQHDSYLFKIGNKDIVRCMAECTELTVLIGKEDTYANLYADLAKRAQDICDAYFWLDSGEVGHLDQPLGEIQKAAASAVDEFEKVVRTRQNTAQQVAAVATRVVELVRAIDYDSMTDINDYVKLLADFRSVRGEIISLKELRYADADQIDGLDAEAARHTEELSERCVEFLLKPQSLQPYHDRVESQSSRIDKIAKVTEARELGEDVAQTTRELEMLTEIMGNLKIDDVTHTTAIIDSISLIYQQLNQVKSRLSNRLAELGRLEGQAEFTSQMKLIAQAVTNYLDACDTPEKCDEYLTRVMVQMETLESRFADFDEFIVELAEKRDELYSGFESRKVQLAEKRNRRAVALMTAGERILKGIRNRVEAMDDVNAINGYFASDRMVERLRETVTQLEDLGDTVKAEDIRSQVKSIQQDAVRQLKDKQALYEDGENVIRFGTHRFAVNRQSLELTIVNRNGEQFFHLTGTGFFERITDEQFLATADIWDMEIVSESPDVYRAEYLAKQMLDEYSLLPAEQFSQLAALTVDALLPRVQEFMAPRYAEGYVKGVHDQDAARILHALLGLKAGIGLLRYPSRARALTLLMMQAAAERPKFKQLAAEIAALGQMQGLFDYYGEEKTYVGFAREMMEEFLSETKLFEPRTAFPAAEYLFHELATAGPIVMSPEAAELRKHFEAHLAQRGRTEAFSEAIAKLNGDPVSCFTLIRKWLRAFVADRDCPGGDNVDELAAIMLRADTDLATVSAPITVEIEGMVGSHPLLTDGRYTLHYTNFVERLMHHELEMVGKFLACQARKKHIIDEFAAELRLGEFKPRVLTTFVRNKLIDQIYLQLVGDNLAKQIGTTGESKRTDRQGLLLLISPPGYGKTTLMEYIANRLGLIFMKINGPAVGNRVTSFDPAEAPNAASREEVQKLNLAFEMGDNVMIYLDDIQHCNPEFLQKFISLCDSQRRVEGVYRGRTSTYDLRGKRVCVVMAGNPYTESGEKFRIPDMLANRADTYNIGDTVGDNHDVFVDSYVENCLTSNPVLAALANHGQADVYSVMKLAEGLPTDSVEFEGAYSADELNEYVATMKKLYVVREVVLKVNQEYIRSAGQAEEYRTEPPFLLQGSYRNMNRIGGRVLPVMNDEELWTLITSAYEQDAQTLTTGAEANLLKFKELVGRINGEEAQRWQDICKTFRRNKLLGGGEDQIGQVIRQLNMFGAGLESIRDTIAQAAGADSSDQAKSAAHLAGEAQQQALARLDERFGHLGQSLDAIGATIAAGIGEFTSRQAGNEEIQSVSHAVLDKLNGIIEAVREDSALQYETAKRHEALTINDNVQSLTSVLEEQFNTLKIWLQPVTKDQEGYSAYLVELIQRFREMIDGYNRLIEVLEASREAREAREAAGAQQQVAKDPSGQQSHATAPTAEKKAKARKPANPKES